MAYPIGRYNLNFDLCAGFLNLLLLFVFFRRKNRRNFRVHLLLISIPEFLFTAAFILPFARKRLFCYDAAGNYARGPLYFLYGLVVIFYSLYGFDLMIGYRKVIRRDFGYVLVLAGRLRNRACQRFLRPQFPVPADQGGQELFVGAVGERRKSCDFRKHSVSDPRPSLQSRGGGCGDERAAGHADCARRGIPAGIFLFQTGSRAAVFGLYS